MIPGSLQEFFSWSHCDSLYFVHINLYIFIYFHDSDNTNVLLLVLILLLFISDYIIPMYFVFRFSSHCLQFITMTEKKNKSQYFPCHWTTLKTNKQKNSSG